jgi:hypothetical protein
MPQLNRDGLREFSANDWLAPVVTFVFLSVYGALRRDGEDRAFARAKAHCASRGNHAVKSTAT